MIEAKVDKCDVSIETNGKAMDLVMESLELMAAIYSNIQQVNPVAAMAFKKAVDAAFRTGLVWEMLPQDSD